LFTFSAKPFLKTGTIIAFFHESGTKPTDNNWLYNTESGLAREYLTFLKKNIGGRPSGPEERLGKKVIVSSTSTIAY